VRPRRQPVRGEHLHRHGNADGEPRGHRAVLSRRPARSGRVRPRTFARPLYRQHRHDPFAAMDARRPAVLPGAGRRHPRRAGRSRRRRPGRGNRHAPRPRRRQRDLRGDFRRRPRTA
jgi:hypothetical protein